MADSAFDPSNLNTAGTDQERITNFLSQLIPALESVMSTGVELGMGRVVNAQLNNVNGVSTPYGSAALTGPQNVGLNAFNFLNNQALAGSMQPAASAVNEAEFDQRARWQQALHFRDLDQAEMMAGKAWNLTNLASSFIFNQAQPQQLLAGLQEASQYLGAGFGSSSGQIATNAQIGQFSRQIATTFLQSQLGPVNQQFNLNGQQLGVLVSELARTGQITQANIADPTGSGFIDRLRQADRAAADTSLLFQGSLTQRLDQLNAISGTDFLGTFGAQASPLLRNLAATGSVVGLQSQQLLGLATASAQLSQRFGLESYGAISNAQIVGEQLGAFRQGGLGGAFIREPRFRQTLIRRTTGAQQSRLARDISGAFSLVEDVYGEDTAQEFVDQLGDGVLTGSDVAASLRAFRNDFSDVTAGNLRNASFTDSAERARARGVATRTALRSNIGLIEAGRRAVLSRRLAGVAGLGDPSQLIENLDDRGGVTLGNLEEALRERGLKGQDISDIVGDVATRFEIQAKQLDLGNRFEADALIRTNRARTTLERIASRTGDRTRIQELFQGRGAVSGFRNLNRLFQSGDSLTIGAVLGLARGDVDLSSEDALRALGSGSAIQRLAKELDPSFTGPLQGSVQEQSEARLGLGALIEGGVFGSIEGEALSQEEQEKVQELLKDEDLNADKVREFFRNRFKGTVKRRKLLVGDEAARLGEKLSPEKRAAKGSRDNLRKSAETILENRELEALDFETLEGDDKQRFLDTLAIESQVAEQFAGEDVKTQRAEIEKRLEGKENLFSFKELQDLKEREDISNDDIALSGTRGGTDGILAQILDVLRKLTDNDITVKVTQDNGTGAPAPSSGGK